MTENDLDEMLLDDLPANDFECQIFERDGNGVFENSSSLFENLLEKDFLISGDQPFSRNRVNSNRKLTEVE